MFQPNGRSNWHISQTFERLLVSCRIDGGIEMNPHQRWNAQVRTIASTAISSKTQTGVQFTHGIVSVKMSLIFSMELVFNKTNSTGRVRLTL